MVHSVDCFLEEKQYSVMVDAEGIFRGRKNEWSHLLAEDLILTARDQFDGENKDSGFKYDETKVKVSYEKVIKGNSHTLTTDIPGTYCPSN